MLFFFSESATGILKIVGIVIGALSTFFALVGGCCKYHNSRDNHGPAVLQGSENNGEAAGVENINMLEQTSKM